jgi:2-oxoglutarate dehydrogenase E1 component
LRKIGAFPAAAASYVEGLYERYREDRDAVGADWAAYFDALEQGDNQHVDGAGDAGVAGLIQAYRDRGHLAADLDPLGLAPRPAVAELDPAAHGLAPADVAAIVDRLKAIYAGTLAVECAHVHDPARRHWIRDAMEAPPMAADAETRRRILEMLIEAEAFEQFMQSRFPTVKRFGLEGAESKMVLLRRLIEDAAAVGVDEVVIGGMHRGRLNLLANLMGKPAAAIFAEVGGASSLPDGFAVSGDVPYHVGFSNDVTVAGRRVHLSLSAHPSHLQVVAAVTLGRARAKQARHGPGGREAILPLLLHTDASFAGQGVMAEIFQLGGLAGFDTGGTIHLIVNNQIGFTTAPAQARTSRYCSDIAKIVEAPVFHVNGDDPEATARAATLAVGYRQRFGRDVVIDLVCYRRRGHNEIDEPRFTQPRMAARIDALPTVRRKYAARLIDDGVVTVEENTGIEARNRERLAAAYEESKTYRPNTADRLEGAWTGMAAGGTAAMLEPVDTGMPLEDLRRIGRALTAVPDSLAFDPKIDRFREARARMIEGGEGIDWATAEALAIGGLLDQGVDVRLCGQDSGRGAFSQRHLVLVDQQTEARFVPLRHLRDGQGRFELVDSPLIEYAVLAFEFGHSLADPHTLVIWEAQFGDFANLAQAVIDQYVVAAEDKWLRQSGLVMLLPHGPEGDGPEHSSARPERFLQLCAEGNIQVVDCSTPANHFHALRRQMLRPFRKPLVVFSPKSLLRRRAAASTLDEMAEGTGFRTVIADAEADPSGVRRVVLCTGKVYYDLAEARSEREIRSVALIRLEQLYPFPEAALSEALAPYSQAEVVWCQEETANGGAWSFVDRRLEAILAALGHANPRPRYVGRPPRPAPAGGLKSAHAAEQDRVVAEALTE